MNKFEVYSGSVVATELTDSFCSKRFQKKDKAARCRRFLGSDSSIPQNGKNYAVCPYGYCATRSSHHIACGFLVDEMREASAAKIKGHINCSHAVFPEVLSPESLTLLCRELLNEDYRVICSLTTHDLANCIGILKTIVSACRNQQYDGEPLELMGLYSKYVDIWEAYERNPAPNRESAHSAIERYNKFLDAIRSAADHIESSVPGLFDYEERYKSVPALLNLYGLQSLFRFRIKYHDMSVERLIHPSSSPWNSSKMVKYNLHRVAKKLCSIQYYPARKKQVQITLLGSTYNTIIAKENLFLAFYILFENAVKYAVPESEIVVRMSDEGSISTIVIENSSKDISEESMKHLTEKGFTGDNCPKWRSSGLGLFLVSEILNDNGVCWRCDYASGRFTVTATFSDCLEKRSLISDSQQ